MDVTNKTKRPLRVPLPGGKKLHLGPGRTGQISPKAVDHPPLRKLVEAGEIEIADGGRDPGSGNGGTNKGPRGVQGHTPTSGIRHVGDR